MIYNSIIRRDPIDRGWSGDRKFCAVTEDGTRYLLRISDISRKERKMQEFSRMQQAAGLGISMCMPVEFGMCEEGVYALHSWIDGEDAGDALQKLPAQTQYALGLDAGRMLKKLHTLPAANNAANWEQFFNAKIDRKLAMYDACPLRYEKDEIILRYLAENRHLLAGRPVTYQHGDYHTGNMMVDNSGKLVIIDFEKDDCGDPWEEFNRIVWCAQEAPEMARGMVEGYFDGPVPETFWRLLILYICSNTLSSLPWAAPYGQKQVDVMLQQWADIRSWYNNFESIVPTWYRKDEIRC